MWWDTGGVGTTWIRERLRPVDTLKRRLMEKLREKILILVLRAGLQIITTRAAQTLLIIKCARPAIIRVEWL